MAKAFVLEEEYEQARPWEIASPQCDARIPIRGEGEFTLRRRAAIAEAGNARTI